MAHFYSEVLQADIEINVPTRAEIQALDYLPPSIDHYIMAVAASALVGGIVSYLPIDVRNALAYEVYDHLVMEYPELKPVLRLVDKEVA